MGTYLATGIVQKVLVRKKDMESKKLHVKDIEKSLQNELNLEHYVCNEDEGTISWKIKPEMLEGNFVEFLETQFKMYEDTIDKDAQLTIEKVKEAKTGENIIELANSKSLIDFQMVDYIYESLNVLRQDGFFSEHLPINYHLMAFFIDGKIIMECYGKILHYFERNIRLQEGKYPIVRCLKTMITS